MLKFMLMILDGFGLRSESENNAVLLADTPNIDRLMAGCPMVPLEASGPAVGLPDGVMGNSEVGHMNIGAGRIVRQDLVRINDDAASGRLAENTELINLFQSVKQNHRTLHLMGLFSDGGVHSHLDHLETIIRAAANFGLSDIAVHAVTDGRDTPPRSGIRYIAGFQQKMNEIGVGRIATVCGRYYMMDRDQRWDRVEKGYRLLTESDGEKYDEPAAAVQASYDNDVTDEFILPKVIGTPQPLQDGDGLLLFNYRADRMREITRALTEDGFSAFSVRPLNLHLTTMTRYQENFTVPVLFPPEQLTNIFGEILAQHHLRQLRIAETEKYAHVTYFFNGGSEQTFDGEDRILVPSPKVATYDLQPEMSAPEVTDGVMEAIRSDKYEGIILNFANPDMVGHTGILAAAIRAAETVDRSVGRITELLAEKDAALFLTADHGNLEMMVDPETGQPHTAHTTNPVPFLLKTARSGLSLDGTGKLADIAPTILDFLEVAQPKEMTGRSLLTRRG